MYDNENQMPDVKGIVEKFERVKSRYTQRDARMGQLQLVRSGRMSEVAPDLFPEAGPFQEPIVANMLDIAARDMAEMIAPLPSLNCTSPSMTSEKDREKASLRTKIANGYLAISNLQNEMYKAADWLVTYGFLPFRVDIDYSTNMPIVRTLNPIGAYYDTDRFNRIVCFYQKSLLDKDELMSKYPQFAKEINNLNGPYGGKLVELIFYHDKHGDAIIANGKNPVMVSYVPNQIGKVMVRVAERPYVGDNPRGQFDDVLFVQLAKSRFALLAMKAAHDSVNAPLVLPSDVNQLEMGDNAILRTNNPQGVRRVPLELSAAAFQEQASLEREMTLGARFPQARTGNIDSSVVTGKGVQELMGGYDTQIRTYQSVIASALEEIIGLCFEIDEVVFGGMTKELRGNENGTPFEVKYDAAKAIKGNYTVDVSYGLMAGLDPNRWLVFALQARAEKMFSRDFMRRQMPVELDAEEQKKEIDMEDMEEAAKQAILSYAQAIPAMAAQGQDPQEIINRISEIMDMRRKGKSIIEAVAEAFAPKEPTEEELAEEQMMMQQAQQGQQPQPPGQPGTPGMIGAGGQPDLNMMLAGLTAGGEPNLAATVARRRPI